MVWTKEQILSEIRRTAEDNGGQPLGRQRFRSATGIRESDWSGRYWARWSDVLKDAGFGPNPWQGRLPDEDLLESLASLVQELGHFPVQAELRLKARSDPTFPSHGTFHRLGNKAAIAAQLQAFSSHHGKDDVAALCALVASGTESPPEISESPPVGVVYLVKAGRFYKIGRTNAPGRREYELALQLPERAKLVHSITTDDPAGIEGYWHRRFGSRRQNGEWFELTAQDVAAFRRRKFM